MVIVLLRLLRLYGYGQFCLKARSLSALSCRVPFRFWFLPVVARDVFHAFHHFCPRPRPQPEVPGRGGGAGGSLVGAPANRTCWIAQRWFWVSGGRRGAPRPGFDQHSWSGLLGDNASPPARPREREKKPRAGVGVGVGRWAPAPATPGSLPPVQRSRPYQGVVRLVTLLLGILTGICKLYSWPSHISSKHWRGRPWLRSEGSFNWLNSGSCNLPGTLQCNHPECGIIIKHWGSLEKPSQNQQTCALLTKRRIHLLWTWPPMCFSSLAATHRFKCCEWLRHRHIASLSWAQGGPEWSPSVQPQQPEAFCSK